MRTCVYMNLYTMYPYFVCIALPSIFHTAKEATTKYFGRWAA